MRFDTPHGCAVSLAFVAHATSKVVDGRLSTADEMREAARLEARPEWRAPLDANATKEMLVIRARNLFDTRT